MAKGAGKTKRSRAQAPGREKPLLAGEAVPVGSALRSLLHRLEARLGLFPPDSGSEGRGRFHAPVILKPNEDVPEGMRTIFPTELAALERIGKAAGQCHAFSLPTLKVYCLPYYYFDGFNALLYAERAGAFVAAWKEQETDGEGSPRMLHTPLPAGEFLNRIREELEVSG